MKKTPKFRVIAKPVLTLAVAISFLCSLLTGCHGSVQHHAFTVPDTFDTTQNYEISFWAKNDTNLTQVNIYKQAIADFEALYTCTDFHNFTYIVMTYCHADRNGVLCPVVPLVYMYVSTADCCFVNFNFNIIWTNFRNRNTFHP